MKKRLATLVILSCIIPVTIMAADDSSTTRRVRKMGQTLFELQQNFETLKADYDDQKKKWQAQQEEFNLLIKNLLAENKTLIEESKRLRAQVETFEEIVESADNIQVAQDINELNQLLKAIILNEVGDEVPAEETILEIVNDAESNIPRDLLVLYLASRKEKENKLDESLGYYGTLVTEFPDSQYVFKAIMSMSNVFGKMGKIDEQKTLLNQLIYLDEENPYSLLAKDKLIFSVVSGSPNAAR